jgi:general secretion pathway protein C
MDVAQHLAQWKGQSPEQWLKTANRFLPPIVTAVLVLAIAYQLAALTWSFVPGSAPAGLPAVAPAPAGGAATQPSSSFGMLPQAHLFGEAPEQTAPAVEEAVVDAPDTTLSLRLTGILFGEGGAPSAAIIASSRGEEKTYQLGQNLDGADGTTLHSVYSDRVILNRGGRLETLRQPKELSAGGGSRMGSPMPAAAAPLPDGGSLRQVISDNATRLTEIFRLAPHVEQGQVVGFRINPGRDRQAFEEMGLVPGDIVTEINGQVLDDPSVGLQVFESLGDATQANVTILREGVPQVIVVDTSTFSNLPEENRE